ncbi:MAG: cation transporter [Stygiobacter sp.]|jgi:copper chaperone CopZ|uniref:Cation transporter n=1 Tax=Stygiobacter electus TaxID=3032292 RepID=A0AAE3TD54_9BACT|nr:cation transporter [Stygiobacter electus]MDF1610863.1 cation transporter [Stygiobacter electus]
MKELVLQVSGMTCHHCVMAVKKELSKLQLESFDVEIGSAKVKFDDSKVSENEIEKAIEEAGYKVVK